MGIDVIGAVLRVVLQDEDGGGFQIGLLLIVSTNWPTA